MPGPSLKSEGYKTVTKCPKQQAECRRMAEHYLACAKQMSDPADRAALLEMAGYWKRLTECAEKRKGEDRS
jgi:hypothetical protein